MTRLFSGTVAAALLLIASSAPAQEVVAELASGYSPRPLFFEVDNYRDAKGGRWIHMSYECECVYRANMETVAGILWDFADSPKVFSRVESVRLRSGDERSSVTEQRTAIRVLGLSFISELVFKNSFERPGPKETIIDFGTIETDGSCLSSKGSWVLEDWSDSSGPVTYVKYSVDGYVALRFPGQAAIMRSFGPADVKRVMRELGEAISKKGGRS